MAQSSITKFFRPKPGSPKKVARQSLDENRSPNMEDEAVTPTKRHKPEIDTEEGPSKGGGLTPDQKRRASENQLRAKIKLTSRQLEGALHPNVGTTWFAALECEFKKDYFAKLSVFLTAERAAHPNKIYPPQDQVWSWTHHFDVKDTKVVILGQDPYHGPGQAHGLCFSVQKGIPCPPSLVNMYKELSNDIEGFTPPQHGFLEGWSKQGVLLLNACLTVRKGEANSHKDRGWENLTDAVVKLISNQCHGVVFLLWGSYAQKKAAAVDAKKHHLLKSVHPSPLSAHRGFLGCKHFSECNKLLKKQGKVPIDWAKL